MVVSGIVEGAVNRYFQEKNKMDTTHVHPINASAKVVGRLIRHPERLEKGDLHDSKNGKWEHIPLELVGAIVRKNPGVLFVRLKKP